MSLTPSSQSQRDVIILTILLTGTLDLQKAIDLSQSTQPVVAEAGPDWVWGQRPPSVPPSCSPSPWPSQRQTHASQMSAPSSSDMICQSAFFWLLSSVTCSGIAVQKTVHSVQTLHEGKWPFSIVRKITLGNTLQDSRKGTLLNFSTNKWTKNDKKEAKYVRDF